MLSSTALGQATQISSAVVSAAVARTVSAETEKKFAVQFQSRKAPNCKAKHTMLSQRLMADFKYPLLTSHNLLWRRITQMNAWWHQEETRSNMIANFPNSVRFLRILKNAKIGYTLVFAAIAIRNWAQENEMPLSAGRTMS